MKLKYGIAPIALAALVVTGCESTGIGSGSSSAATTTTTTTSSSADTQRMAQMERELASLRTENNRLRASASSTTTRQGIQGDADLPPAKPGECYARILIPAEFKTSTERVVDTEASERVEIIPARYETVQERVLVSEASERLEVIPATYKTVTEQVVVEPAREELRTVPARYETRSERVLVREGYTTWKKGEGPIGGSLSGGTITDRRELPTGEIMCLVEVPAEYRTVQRQVLVTPAKTDRVTIPAKTRTVTKQVVDRPASTRPVTIPAKYETVTVRKQVSPATEKRVPIPATYRTVTKQERVSEERLVWREVLCETNTTPDIVRRVQVALRNEGFNVAADGQLGPSTMRAVEAYQRREGLGTGGLTMATVKKLGVM